MWPLLPGSSGAAILDHVRSHKTRMIQDGGAQEEPGRSTHPKEGSVWELLVMAKTTDRLLLHASV